MDGIRDRARSYGLLPSVGQKGMAYYEMKYRQHQIQWVIKQAAALNLKLVPATEVIR